MSAPIEVSAAVILRDGKYLIARRAAGKRCGLLWEFPGGKREPGESGEACVERECAEELGITLRAEKEWMQVTEGGVRLTFYACTLTEGEPRPLEHAALAWVEPCMLLNYQLCPADEVFVRAMRRKDHE